MYKLISKLLNVKPLVTGVKLSTTTRHDIILKEKIGFIGCGNMTRAICEGIVRKRLVRIDQIYVAEPVIDKLEDYEKMGANITTQNQHIVEQCDIVFLCIKQDVLPLALRNIEDTIKRPMESRLFISVLAGITVDSLENGLSFMPNPRVIRAMPNTPVKVGEGCTVFSPGKNITPSDIVVVKNILDSLGLCRQVPEKLINAIGSLVGCGPAFVYLVIEAMADGAVKMGIPRDLAQRLSAQTVLGAARLSLDDDRHTATLRDEVCSPGGTTITGIHVLEKGGVRATLMNAIEAATLKSEEFDRKKNK